MCGICVQLAMQPVTVSWLKFHVAEAAGLVLFGSTVYPSAAQRNPLQ